MWVACGMMRSMSDQAFDDYPPGRAKVLDWDQIIQIRGSLAAGVSRARVAKDHQVSTNTITQIKQRKTWKHHPLGNAEETRLILEVKDNVLQSTDKSDG